MKKTGIAVFVASIALFSTVNIAVASSTDATGNMSHSNNGMLIPSMDPVKGRKLFASKGCVVCHSINGVGGEDAPSLDASNMPDMMNPFDFAAKMWRGAGTMIVMQEDELGEQIEFTGEELADIIAFVHNADEQKNFSKDDIPPKISKIMDAAED